VQRNPVVIIWVIGLAIALAVYAAGPFDVTAVLVEAVNRIWWFLGDLVHAIPLASFGAVRALAVGLFVVFVGLSLLAIRAGHRGRAGLVVISVLFLALIWHQETAYANPRWFAALVLAGVGAMVMTSRLLGPSRTSAAPPPPKQQQGFGPTRTF
jgi:hypothetical protein